MSDTPAAGPLILVVDDEPTVLRSLTAALALGGGFRVLVAENGAAGLETFMRAVEEIDLVVADIVMPFMNGLEMADRIKALRPDLPILLITAYSDSIIPGITASGLPLLRKPFLPEDLIRAVQANLKPPAATA